jgi:Arc/MetJ-type ribon-helix-helix transcriptional regulator
MQRLPNTPEGETKPIGFRLPPPMLAMIDREVGALRAASPEGASVTRSTALRALLVELEQRRAADPTSTPAPRLPRASLARIVAAVEGAGAELRGLLEEDGEEEVGGGEERDAVQQVRRAEGRPAVLHTAAGQLSLLTPTANDAAPASRPSESAEVLAALKPRLLAAHAAGHSAKAIGRTASVDPACITRWLKGTRAGVSVASAHKLGEYLASIGF